MIMRYNEFIRSLSILTIFLISLSHSLLHYQAKFIGHTRVSGSSYSIIAASVTQCLAICNKDATCDAITYYTRKHKCRVFTRCQPLQPYAENSTFYYFYAKRPIIRSGGYTYDDSSDSCLSITPQMTTYETGNSLCQQNNGRIAILETPEMTEIVTSLLRRNGYKYAWVNLAANTKTVQPDYSTRKRRMINPENDHNKLDYFTNSKENCVVVRDNGQWSKAPCNGERYHSICQVIKY